MSSDRRQYRVQQRRRFFTVSLQAPELEPAEGIVVDISSRGVACLFEEAYVKEVSPGAPVALDLQALLLTSPIHAQGIVRHVGTEDGITQLGIEFVESESVMSQVPYVMLREFNRRSAPRVDVEEHVEVDARRLGLEGSLRGQLLDVSTGGLCMRLFIDPDYSLEGPEAWELRFQLPGVSRELTFVGSLCALRSEPGGTVTSVEFSAEETADHKAQRAALQEFVSARLQDQPAERNSGGGTA